MTRRRTTGFSLIELLVSMAIGLILTLAVSSVLISSEGSKRSSTSVNDINQSGAYAAYVLDRAIRSAGSGFAQSWGTAYGCLLNVSQGASPILPVPSGSVGTGSAFSSVFNGAAPLAALPLRLAPVLIAKDYAGAGGDVLIVMAGASGVSETGVPVAPGPIPIGATSIPLQNALGIGTDDLILLADSAVTTGCLMEQVGSRTRGASSTTLPLAGSYYTGGGANVGLTAFGSSTTAIQLGNAGSTTLDMPQFQLFGVGTSSTGTSTNNNRTLYSRDLLPPPSGPGVTQDVALADSVVQMRALYGVDTTTPPDGVIDAWVDPTSASGYSAAALTDGSAASTTKLRQIVAIRLGLILQSSLAERPKDFQQPTGTTLTLFADPVAGLPSPKLTRPLANSELPYRFRTVEVTIPLRNALLAP